MTKSKRILVLAFSLLLCVMFAVSYVDTNDTVQKTNFDQSNITTHIEKLSENGPRSVADKEANQKALQYIVSELERYGAVCKDTTEKPAYLIQDYVATDSRYQNWYLENVILHVPANAENASGEAILFMGHFDSVPMGEGASDDAVSCATMLEAARYYLDRMANGYTMENDLVFAFVNGEEYGRYGSMAFIAEFTGFENVIDRIKFVTNLESRGTSGTLIMFETAKNNYNTVKLFTEINESLFTCSIATLVYDTMPNYTDFTTFKDAYQGLNMANINGGENYHTQNDKPENVGASYLSQQAQIVDALIDKLGSYDLTTLYEAEESAIFFSYLNLTTVIYDHTAVIVFAVLCILLLLANVVLSVVYRKQKNLRNTAKAFAAMAVGFLLCAGVTYLCYFVFQGIAALAGTIDVKMIGTVTYPNTAITIGIGILSLAVSVLTTHFSCKWLKISGRDLARAFAYLHAALGIALCFALPDASYLFIFSGILLLINELLITAVKRVDLAGYHFELLVIALYFPVVIPVIALAISALGLKMAYVYGVVFALALFDVGVCMTPVCRFFTVRIFSKRAKTTPWEGALHLLAVSMLLFLCASLTKLNASVNLQGKQNIARLPSDDALVYVLNENGDYEYRVYDLNAYGALKKYAPDMEYVQGEYYVGKGEQKDVALSILSKLDGNVLTVKKTAERALVYLSITSEGADSFTVDDGITSQTYALTEGTVYEIMLHANCTVTVNGGSAKVAYKELVRDCEALIPAEYANDEEALHFNLWLTADLLISQ